MYPTAFVKGKYASIMHLTISGDNDIYGSRAPGIWFSKSPSGNTNSILPANAISGKKNWNFYSPRVPLKKWAHMRLMQTLEGGKYIYRVFLNGAKLKEVVNSKPQDFHNVKVFVGDPWYPAQPGYIRNLRIHNGPVPGK